MRFVVLMLCAAASVSGFRGDPQLFPELPTALVGSGNPECARESKLFEDALGNLTLWAFAMWESSARSETGALEGNTHQLGSFEECVHVPGPFRTQYCLAEVHLNIPKPDKLRNMYDTRFDGSESVLNKLYYSGDKSRVPRNVLVMGLCVPASCSHQDVQETLNGHLQGGVVANSNNATYEVKVAADTCQMDRADEVFGVGDIVFCILLVVIFIAVICCTIYDLRQKEDFSTKSSRKPLSARIFQCFSATKNFSDLSKFDDSNEALRILYGMRTISILLIIVDHRFGTYITGPILNREFVEEHYRSFASLFIFHGDLFVDSFFVLSGLLVTYNLLVAFEKRITSPLLIIINRYVRLTPIYAVVVFFYATMLYRTGSGPLWKLIIGNMQADCQNNWWASLLYISNYVNDDKMCMVHSWFLPCDFHYFILAIPTILFLKRRTKMAIVLMFIALILSFLIPFGITLYYRRPALLNFYIDFLASPKTHPDFRMTYTKSHTRVGAYIIGMFTGFAYFKLRNSTIKLSLIKSNVLTIVGLLLMFGGMASGGVFYDPYHAYNAIEAALYAGLHRPAWALGSAILLLNASYGHVGIMRVILEWKPWVPLSKLVYGAYLVHMCWQLRSTAMVMSPRYATVFDILTLALGDVVLSFALAFALYLLVEAPTRRLFRELMIPRSKRVNVEPKPQEVTVPERTVIAISNGTEDSHL